MLAWLDEYTKKCASRMAGWLDVSIYCGQSRVCFGPLLVLRSVVFENFIEGLGFVTNKCHFFVMVPVCL